MKLPRWEAGALVDGWVPIRAVQGTSKHLYLKVSLFSLTPEYWTVTSLHPSTDIRRPPDRQQLDP